MELVMVVNLQFYKGKIVIKSKIEIRKYSFRAYREARRFMCFFTMYTAQILSQRIPEENIDTRGRRGCPKKASVSKGKRER